MKLGDFLSSYRGQQSMNRLLLIIVLVLAVAMVGLAFGYAGRRETVILVPPQLRAETAIGAFESSPEYKSSWGLYFAQLVGNVTPQRLAFIKSTLEQFLAPDIFQQSIQRLELESESVKRDQVALKFEAQKVSFDAQRNLVIVQGQSIVQPAIGAEKRGPRTYEFEIEIHEYRPVLRSMATYEGAPKPPGAK